MKLRRNNLRESNNKNKKEEISETCLIFHFYEKNCAKKIPMKKKKKYLLLIRLEIMSAKTNTQTKRYVHFYFYVSADPVLLAFRNFSSAISGQTANNKSFAGFSSITEIKSNSWANTMKWIKAVLKLVCTPSSQIES